MLRRGGLLAVLLATAPVFASAQAPPSAAAGIEDGEDIVVVGQNGEPYRLTADALRDAMQAFRRGRATFAPDARLLFAVASTGRSRDTLALALRRTKRERDGRWPTIALPIDAQGRFSIPDTVPLDGSWELSANRARGRISIRPLVLSPGTVVADDGSWMLSSNGRARSDGRAGASPSLRAFAPGDTAMTGRRLGDLRLQCRVGLAFLRAPAPLRLIVDSFNVCANRRFALTLKSQRPLASATLRWPGGDRPLDTQADSYRVPLADRTVPDAARLVLTYR